MPDLEQRFRILCQITRAQHFAWRAAVSECAPDVDAEAVVTRMWELTGEQTGAAYAKRFDRTAPLAPQFAHSIAWSSQCMGEDAVVEEDPAEPGVAWVRHRDCPWVHWHRRQGLLSEDQPGCDAWFRSTIAYLNRAGGPQLQFETVQSLPEGADSCLRRLWVEPG